MDAVPGRRASRSRHDRGNRRLAQRGHQLCLSIRPAIGNRVEPGVEGGAQAVPPLTALARSRFRGGFRLSYPEPHRLGGLPIGHAPRGREGRREQQPVSTGALGGNVLVLWGLGHQAGRVAIADHDLDPAAGQLAGDLDRGPGVHHRIGDKLAGEQHGVIDEAVADGRGAADEPGLQRVADEAACRSGGRRLRLVCRGRDKTVQSLHVPSPLWCRRAFAPGRTPHGDPPLPSTAVIPS